MAKDYFQDIVPPSDDAGSRTSRMAGSVGGTPVPIRTNPAPVNTESAAPPLQPDTSRPSAALEPGERSIRNIAMPSRPRPMGDTREAALGMHFPQKPRSSRWWLWAIAGISIVVLGMLLFISMRSTVVTVVPRAQALTFDESSQFAAYPAASAASGTLAYSVQTIELEDSQVVPSSGSVHAEEKASGTITVYNNFQSSSLRLVKNTRFATPEGLIFRSPADILVPGRTASGPGQVSVTVVADDVGEKYNVAAVRFTVPGLKSSADMYTKVYAQSNAPMTGGFVGERAGVATGALENAVAEVRGRLEKKARESLASNAEVVVFPDLAQISYQDMPNTDEAGGGVRIHQKARVLAPVFESARFAHAIADASAISIGSESIKVQGGAGYGARALTASSTFGVDALQFALSGTATLIWDVDTAALTQALAGKDQAAFEGIVTGFPGVQEARARIEPFWKNAFPAKASDIKVEVEAPAAK